MSNRTLALARANGATIDRAFPAQEKKRFWLPFEARARARKGALLLDEKFGPGWARKISLPRLDITDDLAFYSWGRCALTQVYGRFSRGLTAVGLDYNSAEEYGFSFTHDHATWHGFIENLALVAAFRAEIKARLA